MDFAFVPQDGNICTVIISARGQFQATEKTISPVLANLTCLKEGFMVPDERNSQEPLWLWRWNQSLSPAGNIFKSV